MNHEIMTEEENKTLKEVNYPSMIIVNDTTRVQLEVIEHHRIIKITLLYERLF